MKVALSPYLVFFVAATALFCVVSGQATASQEVRNETDPSVIVERGLENIDRVGPFAESYDPETGITTSSESEVEPPVWETFEEWGDSDWDDADDTDEEEPSDPELTGNHIVTQTDADGNVINTHEVSTEELDVASASSTDPNTGITTTSQSDVSEPEIQTFDEWIDSGGEDNQPPAPLPGDHIVTTTDQDGNTTNQQTTGNQPDSVSSTSGGITTTVTANPDGSRTITTSNTST